MKILFKHDQLLHQFLRASNWGLFPINTLTEVESKKLDGVGEFPSKIGVASNVCQNGSGFDGLLDASGRNE